MFHWTGDYYVLHKNALPCTRIIVSRDQIYIFWSSESANFPATWVVASEKCQQEKRKTVNGEDILFAMTSLGFENYAEALKIYLAKYREVS